MYFLLFRLSTKKLRERDWDEILLLPLVGFGVGLSIVLLVVLMVTWNDNLHIRFEVRRGFQRLTALVIDGLCDQTVPSEVVHQGELGLVPPDLPTEDVSIFSTFFQNLDFLVIFKNLLFFLYQGHHEEPLGVDGAVGGEPSSDIVREVGVGEGDQQTLDDVVHDDVNGGKKISMLRSWR